MNNRISALTLLMLLSTGCAAMKEAWVARNCNHDGAYAAGMNEARAGQRMDPNWGSLCSSENLTALRAAYREGYTSGASGAPSQVNVTVAAADQRECVQAFGKEACGYGCVKAYGEVKCGARPGDRCVEAYGKIVCGVNCVKKFGDVVCD
jgi:hypothetical protein